MGYPGNKGFNTAYHGMITAVKAPADKAGLYQLVKSSETSTAKADLQSYDNWQKISVSESEFKSILDRVTAVETSDTKKLDKDFVTNSSQGSLGEGTTFAARSDNTADATNVYITGKQIKDFAASAVSDKGTYADEDALKAAYPTSEDGWSATVLSTGTTWISKDGAWTDSGKSNGVTSVNGKSGKVTLVAADIDDVLSDTETDEHIEAAITTKERTWSEDSKLVGNLSVTGAIEQVGNKAQTAIDNLKSIDSRVDTKQDKLNLYSDNATTAVVNGKLEVKDTLSTDGDINLGGKLMQDGVDVLAGKQNSLLYYTETIPSDAAPTQKLSAWQLDINNYNTYIGSSNLLINADFIAGTGITSSFTDATEPGNVSQKLVAAGCVVDSVRNKQNKQSDPGFLYLKGGYAISECKPTFSSAQSLVFTYKVTEEELDDVTWSILGNMRIWDAKKGIGIAKQSKAGGNGLQCGFNWSGNSTDRTFITFSKDSVADGKTHTYALICGKTSDKGFFKCYQDNLRKDLKSIAVWDDFTPTYGFYLGKHATSSSTDNSAKGKISRIAFFNFDISDETKAYTLEDYINGKDIPNSLITATEGDRAIWALDNYTYTSTDSSSKYLKDIVGGNNATITGDIKDAIDNKFENNLSNYQPTLKYYSENTTNQIAEFSKIVKAPSFQIGEQVSSNSSLTKLNGTDLNFNTPAGNASFGYNGITVTNSSFIVKGSANGDTPYVQIPDSNNGSFKIWKGTETKFKALTSVNSDTVYLRAQDNNRIKATVGTDTASLENITDSYTLSSMAFTSFITDTKYNNAQGSILITPSLTNSGALIFGEGITDISKGFPLYPDNIVSIPFKNITNFKVAGSINDSFNYIVSFDI